MARHGTKAYQKRTKSARAEYGKSRAKVGQGYSARGALRLCKRRRGAPTIARPASLS